MITGRTEKEYRKLEIDSYSSIKLFAENRKKYYKKFYLKENVEEEESSKASIVGSLTDCFLLDKNNFDSKFALSSLAKIPTGKMLDFCNALVNITLENTGKNFEEMATEARKIAQFEWKLPAILDKFAGKDPEIYYKESLDIKSRDLLLVDLQDIQNSERVVEELKNNIITKDIFNLVNSDRYSIYNQLQVEGFEIDELPLKMMADRIICDHKLKNISIFDLKVTYSVEDFYWAYYLNRLSYIQAYIYYYGIKYWAAKNEMEEYHVDYPKFIVADSINHNSPLIYFLYGNDLGEAYDGFIYNGRKYKGVCEIIKDLKFARDNNEWRISRANFEADGVVHIKS